MEIEGDWGGGGVRGWVRGERFWGEGRGRVC